MNNNPNRRAKKKSNNYRHSPFSRFSYICTSLFLAVYALFSMSYGFMYLPARRGEGFALNGFSAVLMCIAFICASANLMLYAMETTEKKKKPRSQSFAEFTKVFGWLFFFLSLIVGFFEMRQPRIH